MIAGVFYFFEEQAREIFLVAALEGVVQEFEYVAEEVSRENERCGEYNQYEQVLPDIEVQNLFAEKTFYGVIVADERLYQARNLALDGIGVAQSLAVAHFLQFLVFQLFGGERRSPRGRTGVRCLNGAFLSGSLGLGSRRRGLRILRIRAYARRHDRNQNREKSFHGSFYYVRLFPL